jgi:hypothetical protein
MRVKRLRFILIALAVPAALLLGLHELGGTPISKGYDTGFEWRADPNNKRLILAADPEGNMTCWLSLELPQNLGPFTAETSTGTQLKASVNILQNSKPGIAITKNTQNSRDPFDWPSGVTLFLYVQSQQAGSLAIGDWYVFPSNKAYDSRSRSNWRSLLFKASIVLFGLALIGAVFEGIEKARGKDGARDAFSAEYCLRQLINRVEGDNPEQSEQMRTVLQKLLLEGVELNDALAPLPFSVAKKYSIARRALKNLHNTLESLITGLAARRDQIDRTIIRFS